MNTIPIITSILALFLSLGACLINVYLVVSIFCVKKISKRSSFSLIFGRFFVDSVYTFGTSANLIYLLINTISPDSDALRTSRNVLFFIAWPNYILGSTRALFVFFITLDRCLATCFPIHYHKYRSSCPTRLIFGFTLAYALFENFLLFGVCDYQVSVAEECTHFGCAVNQCYHEGYWMNFEQITYFSIGVLSIILSTRLFWIWNNRTHKSKELSRANRIALLDTFIILVADLSPAFLFSHIPTIRFESIGPLSAVCKNSGFVVEGLIVCHLLLWKSRINPSASAKTTS